MNHVQRQLRHAFARGDPLGVPVEADPHQPMAYREDLISGAYLAVWQRKINAI